MSSLKVDDSDAVECFTVQYWEGSVFAIEHSNLIGRVEDFDASLNEAKYLINGTLYDRKTNPNGCIGYEVENNDASYKIFRNKTPVELESVKIGEFDELEKKLSNYDLRTEL